MKNNSLSSLPEYDILSSAVGKIQDIPNYKLTEPKLSTKMTQK